MREFEIEIVEHGLDVAQEEMVGVRFFTPAWHERVCVTRIMSIGLQARAIPEC